MAESAAPSRKHSVLRSLGLGLITGAADDDCSAIGTYAQAGAQLGYRALWIAPALLPMMVTVVYLSGKLGLVTGQGLFSVLRSHSSRWLLYLILTGVLIGNMIEAGADIGAMAAAFGILVHVPRWLLILSVSAAALALQVWGSYGLIRNVLRVLALVLLTYVASAFLAHPKLSEVVRGTFVPSLHFDRDSLAILVAMIGTSLSAYLYTWQSNEQVEEKVAAGLHSSVERRGASKAELRGSLLDVIYGMIFSSLIMYFIILATAATLHAAGQHTIESAAQAAHALRPLAGEAAGLLFAIGLIGVGLLALPVMTAGAAYDLCQSLGWKNGLHFKPHEAKKFYASIALFTAIAMGLNFTGINPMRALVLAGIVQGISTPPLMVLIMLLTNRESIMGDRVNGRVINVLGWVTTAAIFSASACLVVLWLRH
jgi:NRAMP (natural resistance-associated macrophage protein)-like metal ion transporter